MECHGKASHIFFNEKYLHMSDNKVEILTNVNQRLVSFEQLGPELSQNMNGMSCSSVGLHFMILLKNFLAKMIYRKSFCLIS